jgi:hypothetical protein
MDALEVNKSIKKDTPCPWGTGHHDLSSVDLNLNQKYWLGSRRIFDVSTTRNLCKRFNIQAKRIQNNANAFKKGIILHNGGGRPSTFDKVSVKNLKDATKHSLKPNPVF